MSQRSVQGPCCVVCRGALPADGGRYPNAWEKSLRLRACCSDVCVRAFDPVRHWLPSSPPAPCAEAEAVRLLDVAKSRILRGESAPPLVSELLVAGVEPWRIRRAIETSSIAKQHVQHQHRTLLTLLASGWKRDVVKAAFASEEPTRDLGSTADVIAAWEARFGAEPPRDRKP